MAKLGTVIDTWMRDTEVNISAIQCWTSLEEYFGVVPCTVMSMMSDQGLSSACEVDRRGVIGMHALHWLRNAQRAAGLEHNYAERSGQSGCASCSNHCRNIFSRNSAWTSRKSSPEPSAKRTLCTVVGRVKSRPD